MLVKLVRLRHKGEKLPAIDVKADPGVVGDVFFCERARYERNKPIMLAGCVAPGTANYVVPPLDGAKVTRIRNDGFLITGMEQIDKGTRRSESYKQSWWCRPVELARVDATTPVPGPLPPAKHRVPVTA